MTDSIQNTLDSVVNYFNNTYQKHGAVAEGVDYNSTDAQVMRFAQLEKILDVVSKSERFSILDYGCGYGAFPYYLKERGYTFDYVGYDISTELITAANANPSKESSWHFTDKLDSLKPVDFTIACGVFNIKLEANVQQWQDFFLQQLEKLNSLSKRGFSFNTLTSYSDADKMADHLYYPDPKEVFDYCINNFSRNVALLHDYKLYDCTYLVRIDD